MDPDAQEEIERQHELLKTYRRNLAHGRRRAAQYGGESFAPDDVANSIHEARAQVQRIKAALRRMGADVADRPDDDTEAPSRPKATEAGKPAPIEQSQDMILIIGSGVIENVLTIDGDIKINQKHIVHRKELFGGSGINYTFRLTNTHHPVLPILSIGNDNLGEKIQREILCILRKHNYPDQYLRFVGEKGFLCVGITTAESTVVVSKSHRTIFTEELKGVERFKDFVERRIDKLDKLPSLNVKAVMIGHIHADNPQLNPDEAGAITKRIIERYRGRSLIFTNFGDSQISLGHQFWEDELKDVDIFQLSLGETRRFFSKGGRVPPITEIVEWFRARKITAVITLDRFGAIATFKGDPRIIIAWPLDLEKIVDTTGAGDAFGAGLISKLYQEPDITFSKFFGAIEEARIWATYACTTFGAANDCPDREILAKFRSKIEMQPESNLVESHDPNNYQVIFRLLDKAYLSF